MLQTPSGIQAGSAIRFAPPSLHPGRRCSPRRTRSSWTRPSRTWSPRPRAVTSQCVHTALSVQSSTLLFVRCFIPDRIPTNKYKRLKKRDLRLSRQTTITGTLYIVWCACALCFSLACRRQRRRPSLAVSHCMTGARAFFGDFTWKERCSSARRNPECAGDFGFSTYKPRGIL